MRASTHGPRSSIGRWNTQSSAHSSTFGVPRTITGACGNLMQARHYSLYLALQLKARYEGLPTPVYFVDPVHHLK